LVSLILPATYRQGGIELAKVHRPTGVRTQVELEEGTSAQGAEHDQHDGAGHDGEAHGERAGSGLLLIDGGVILLR
jgi:hypothetical protein